MIRESTGKRHATYLIVAAIMLAIPLIAGRVAAQTAVHSRLRVVVRSDGGHAVAGIQVEVWRVEADESETDVTAALTGAGGFVDFDVTGWPVGAYAFIFTSASSGYAVESREEQEKSYTPFGTMLNKTGDEWAMYLLHPDGRIEPDISYDLNARPRPPNYLAPAPRPESWTQMLTKRGLPVALPPPFPNNTPTAVTSTPAAASSGSSGPGSGVAPPPSAPQSGGVPVTWLAIGAVCIGYLIWTLRRRKEQQR